MNVGFYSARSGVLSNSEGMDIISNNIANSETIGYKDLRPSFSDLLYTTQRNAYPEAQMGHGTKINKSDLMYSRGQLQMTNRDLDFVAPNDGFFAVETSTGEVNYTKDGAFCISQNGNRWELVNSNGDRVLNYDKNVITIDDDKVNNIDAGEIMNNIGVFTFNNPYGLEANGNNQYKETLSSGNALADRTLDKLNGALEMSTVDMAEQMVKVIEYQRAFQFNSKMIQTHDEMESLINNLR